MGEVPLWYRVIKAAQYLGCPPWELEARGLRYLRQAEEASVIETATAQPPTQTQATSEE